MRSIEDRPHGSCAGLPRRSCGSHRRPDLQKHSTEGAQGSGDCRRSDAHLLTAWSVEPYTAAAPDGRRHGFVVDRIQQVWWAPRPASRPASSDLPGAEGFGGHWGPRVTHDPNSRRRAGMSVRTSCFCSWRLWRSNSTLRDPLRYRAEELRRHSAAISWVAPNGTRTLCTEEFRGVILRAA